MQKNLELFNMFILISVSLLDLSVTSSHSIHFTSERC